MTSRFALVSSVLCSVGVLAAALVTGSHPAWAKAPKRAEPSMASNAKAFQQQSVTALYISNCSNCHGVHGEGGGAGTTTLLSKEKFSQDYDKRYFNAIKNGLPERGMDPYGQTLSDPQVWALVVHIRELQRDYLKTADPGPQPVNGVYPTEHLNYRVETVINDHQGLKTPWSIAWLPDGKMLVTNRPGYMVLVSGKTVLGKIQGTPATKEMGQGGLMEVAVHPNYSTNGWIYLSFTDLREDGKPGGFTKYVRGKLNLKTSPPTWTNQQTIFQARQEDYVNSDIHFGNRLVFDRKGHIFFCLGERGSGNKAQDKSLPNGKIYRLNEDGSVPSDNPYVGEPGIAPKIWSYGHRNPQGLSFDLKGNLWDTEHGPRGGDELNLIQKGKNYGWPNVAFSINYNDSPLVVPWPKPDQHYTMPVLRWLPSIAPSGLACVTGKPFAPWKGDFLCGGLAGQIVDRVRVRDGKVEEEEAILRNMGRVRDVRIGLDGLVYVALNQPDKIIRLVPAR